MVAFPLAKKPMYIMLLRKVLKAGSSMQLKFIRLPFWCSRIEKDMCRVSLDLEEGIALPILVKWLKCGLRRNLEI